jgi:diguanylate cyclase (GGDEF)-like protein
MAGTVPLRQIDRLRLIIETQRLANASYMDGDDLMLLVTERTRVIAGADGAMLATVDGDELVCRAASGSAAGRLGGRVRLQAGLLGLCVGTAECLRCEDTETGPGVDRDACRRAGVRSLVAVPLMHDGRAFGVLEVVAEEPSRFSEPDVDALQLAVSLVAGSLVRATDYGIESHKAMHDGLTGLPNRALLMDRLRQVVEKARRLGTGVAVFFIDLDGFSAVNDRYGRATGDELLCAVAREMAAVLRASDTLARFGADEFVVVCDHADEIVGSIVTDRVAEAMRRVSASSPTYGDVTATVGAAWSPAGELSADEMLAAADASMYQAKRRRPEATS